MLVKINSNVEFLVITYFDSIHRITRTVSTRQSFLLRNNVVFFIVRRTIETVVLAFIRKPQFWYKNCCLHKHILYFMSAVKITYHQKLNIP